MAKETYASTPLPVVDDPKLSKYDFKCASYSDSSNGSYSNGTKKLIDYMESHYSETTETSCEDEESSLIADKSSYQTYVVPKSVSEMIEELSEVCGKPNVEKHSCVVPFINDDNKCIVIAING